MVDATVARAIGVRPARIEDAAAVAAIWNHEVRFTDATTDTEPRSLAEQRAWLVERGEDHPVVVATRGAAVVGFGALSPYRSKPAFRQTVENSVYVDRDHRAAGIGSAILGELVRLARAGGHHSVIARITGENVASMRLHERHGFRLVGVERETAFKRGRWLDVAIMQLLLG